MKFHNRIGLSVSEKNHKNVIDAALFFFAHQDDETAVFKLIEDELKSGAQVHCFYYTSGTFSGLSSIERNN